MSGFQIRRAALTVFALCSTAAHLAAHLAAQGAEVAGGLQAAAGDTARISLTRSAQELRGVLRAVTDSGVEVQRAAEAPRFVAWSGVRDMSVLRGRRSKGQNMIIGACVGALSLLLATAIEDSDSGKSLGVFPQQGSLLKYVGVVTASGIVLGGGIGRLFPAPRRWVGTQIGTRR